MPICRLGFVGPFLGKYPGFPSDQAEHLADRFEGAGYVVLRTSSKKNKWLRLLDVLCTLLSWSSSVDLVLINVYSGLGFGMADAASLVACRLNLPVIFVLHGGNLPEFSSHHSRWVKRVLARGDGFVAPSAFLAEAFKSLCPVKVIPNIIDIDAYTYRLRSVVKPNLFWMRTFEDIYNPEMAVETLARLKKFFPEANMTMAGRDNGLLDSIRLLAQKRGIFVNIRFVGFLDMAGKQYEFSNHDIFLNTNRIDNMPISIMEAAASGLPVVATSVGGIKYLLKDDETALLVENEDVDGMVQSIQRLLTDPPLVEKLSKNGREMVEKYSWPHVRLEWENLFQQIMQSRNVKRL